MLTDVEPRESSPVLVGRSGQLSALDAALAEAGRGRPPAIMIGGEAGVGKSRLVREFAERSRGNGARVLIGGCLELGADSLPFTPFTAVLRELVREVGAAGVAGLLPGGSSPELARLLPEFGAPAGWARGVRRGPGCSSRCSWSWRAWPKPVPWCWSSRTCTGPTSPPGTCWPS